jgi:hypothetical protein
VNLIKSKKFTQLSEETSISSIDIFPNDSLKAIHYYGAALEDEYDNEDPAFHLSKINDNYNGVIANDIKKMKERYENRIDEIRNKQKEQDSFTFDAKKSPAIGMDSESIKQSSWGKPNKVNSTVTQYGTIEQWVYDNRGYIYFEDGKVSAIQESK